jgi:hypothetical protein
MSAQKVGAFAATYKTLHSVAGCVGEAPKQFRDHLHNTDRATFAPILYARLADHQSIVPIRANNLQLDSGVRFDQLDAARNPPMADVDNSDHALFGQMKIIKRPVHVDLRRNGSMSHYEVALRRSLGRGGRNTVNRVTEAGT